MKTKQLQGISIAAILSLSIVAIGVIPQAIADEDEYEFSELHFQSAPCILAVPSNEALVEDQLGITVNSDYTLDGADCSVKAWFDDEAQVLKYSIKVRGMESIDRDGNPLNDIGKMHFHKDMDGVVLGDPPNPIGPQHILNIFKAPAQDDDDLKFNKAGHFRGLWDESDTENRTGDNDDTFDITEESTQDILCDGEAFLMVHGFVNDTDKPGFIKASIQPTQAGIDFCNSL